MHRWSSVSKRALSWRRKIWLMVKYLKQRLEKYSAMKGIMISKQRRKIGTFSATQRGRGKSARWFEIGRSILAIHSWRTWNSWHDTDHCGEYLHFHYCNYCDDYLRMHFRMLDHYGKNLNFFQYYLLDVLAFLAFVVAFVVVISLWTCRSCFRIWRKNIVKAKLE